MKYLTLFTVMIFFLLCSCCSEVQEDGKVYLRYPELDGVENTYGIRVIRTRRGDYTDVIDTMYKNDQMHTDKIEFWLDFSKEFLPDKQENQPDLIVYVEIIGTTFNGLEKDSVIYMDSISNIQYEVSRCKIENLSYEFNGVASDSKEIIIDN